MRVAMSMSRSKNTTQIIEINNLNNKNQQYSARINSRERQVYKFVFFKKKCSFACVCAYFSVPLSPKGDLPIYGH